MSVVRASRFYANPAVPPSGQPDFVNCVIAVETDFQPQGLLEVCLGIERELGRIRSDKWGPRSIDIDIIDFDGRVAEGPDLVLPHPRAHERAFVMVPLLEIAPEWRHPVIKKGGQELMAAIDPEARRALRPLALQ